MKPGAVPVTRYARSAGLNIAYQVFGTGPLDLVLVPGFISHVEYAWQEPLLARFLRKLSAFTRVIAFDKRGMGLSDRDPRRETPSLADRADDIGAVLDAARSARAVLLAWSEGGPASLLFASQAPERVAALVLLGTTARFTTGPDFPEGIPRELLELFIDTMREEWGTGIGFELYAPSLPIAALRRSRRRPAAGWESLTEAEQDIVGLVAAGLTNRQIAARLYLSPRTIQTHVSHVMRKLDLARRSEIAAEASRRQR
jgi:pimeloyl-ACP methyl ester carboxylesterase